ncbi:hypothetical protein [Promicromonospora soli]
MRADVALQPGDGARPVSHGWRGPSLHNTCGQAELAGYHLAVGQGGRFDPHTAAQDRQAGDTILPEGLEDLEEHDEHAVE